MRTKRGRPKTAELASLARESLRNAMELLVDAELLAEQGRHSRAYSLTTLAAEEFGKHLTCFEAVGMPAIDEGFWKNFWRGFASHTVKYTKAVEIMKLFHDAGVLAALTKQGEPELDKKMQGFYVDLTEDVTVPDEQITADDAQEHLEAVGFVVHLWFHLFEDVDIASLFAFIEVGVERMGVALHPDRIAMLLRGLQHVTGGEFLFHFDVVERLADGTELLASICPECGSVISGVGPPVPNMEISCGCGFRTVVDTWDALGGEPYSTRPGAFELRVVSVEGGREQLEGVCPSCGGMIRTVGPLQSGTVFACACGFEIPISTWTTLDEG